MLLDVVNALNDGACCMTEITLFFCIMCRKFNNRKWTIENIEGNLWTEICLEQNSYHTNCNLKQQINLEKQQRKTSEMQLWCILSFKCWNDIKISFLQLSEIPGHIEILYHIYSSFPITHKVGIFVLLWKWDSCQSFYYQLKASWQM